MFIYLPRQIGQGGNIIKLLLQRFYSIIEELGTTSTTLTFLAMDFLATVLTSFLPEGLAPLGETVGSTSSTSEILRLVEVRVPYSEGAGSLRIGA